MADGEENSLSRFAAKYLKIKDLTKSIGVRVALGAALIVLIVVMFPHGESIPFNYEVGSAWEATDLVAPFSFAVNKDPKVLDKERQDAARGVYPVFERREDAGRTEIESLAVVVNMLREALSARSKMQKGPGKPDVSPFHILAGQVPFALTDYEWGYLANWQSKAALSKFEQSLIGILSDALKQGILNEPKSKFSQKSFVIRQGKSETVELLDRVTDMDEATGRIRTRLAEAFTDDELRTLADQIVRAVLRPDLMFDQDETDREITAAQDNVPRTLGFVYVGEKIIARNDRITSDVKLKLDSFEKAKVERSAVENDWVHWVGITLHVLIILGLYGIYLYYFRKRIFHNNGRLTIIALLVLMEAWFTHLSFNVNLSDPTQYLIVVPAASMLLAIIFDSRVAFYGTVTLAFLVAGMRGNDYSIGLISFVAGSFAVYTVRDISKRTQIFRSMLYILLGYFVAILAISIERFDSFDTILAEMEFALANSVISPMLTYGLLLVIERVFNVTTDLTLVELSDLTQPLLVDLSEKAPGTYHHSLTIGNLAEAAAEAIGANANLARVGGYYHDIGKMLKPEYFVENQTGTQNRHNRLRPRMSALIIAAHVREGVELGRKYGLPESVLKFIPEHHGTTRISFFYDKAIKQAARRPGKDRINEQDFLYPGPRPQTKETAIVMLSDTVEATTRAIGEMTVQKLESVIKNLIRQRFIEGQLDECDLTLRDLSMIKEAFLKILVGIHHQRIVYPPAGTAEEILLREAERVEAPVEAGPETSAEPSAGSEAGSVAGSSDSSEGPGADLPDPHHNGENPENEI
jgi:putative nucleotidyltransferase with HDIG domain